MDKTFEDQEQVWARQVRNALLDQRQRIGRASAGDRFRLYGEVVEQALASVPSRDRDPCLRALAEWFPAWQPPAPVLPPAPDDSPPVPSRLSGPELVQELTSRVTELSETERQTVLAALQPAGSVAEAENTNLVASSTLSKEFGLDPGAPLDEQRMLALVEVIAEILADIFKLTASIWESLGEKMPANWGQAGDFRSRLGPVLAAAAPGPGVTWESAIKEIERKKTLVLALLNAARDGAFFFTNDTRPVFDPSFIMNAVRAEGNQRPGTDGFKVACWNRYTQKAGDYNPAKVRETFCGAVVKAARNKLPGPGASAAQ